MIIHSPKMIPIKGLRIADKNILFDSVGMNIAIQTKAFDSRATRISDLTPSPDIVLAVGDERVI